MQSHAPDESFHPRSRSRDAYSIIRCRLDRRPTVQPTVQPALQPAVQPTSRRSRSSSVSRRTITRARPFLTATTGGRSAWL
uniref:PT domain-containing protein n=1 Tax=Streptomyces chengmaiensis TaxID=3040919 RepID=UPI0037D991F2